MCVSTHLLFSSSSPAPVQASLLLLWKQNPLVLKPVSISDREVFIGIPCSLWNRSQVPAYTPSLALSLPDILLRACSLFVETLLQCSIVPLPREIHGVLTYSPGLAFLGAFTAPPIWYLLAHSGIYSLLWAKSTRAGFLLSGTQQYCTIQDFSIQI